jgi:hypothetical protein
MTFTKCLYRKYNLVPNVTMFTEGGIYCHSICDKEKRLMTLTSGVNAVNKSFVTHVIIVEQLKLMYIDAALVTKKIFFVDYSGLYYKCFAIVIYDRNDIGLYYKTRDDRN